MPGMQDPKRAALMRPQTGVAPPVRNAVVRLQQELNPYDKIVDDMEYRSQNGDADRLLKQRFS
jgi:hypothetical protein